MSDIILLRPEFFQSYFNLFNIEANDIIRYENIVVRFMSVLFNWPKADFLKKLWNSLWILVPGKNETPFWDVSFWSDFVNFEIIVRCLFEVSLWCLCSMWIHPQCKSHYVDVSTMKKPIICQKFVWNYFPDICLKLFARYLFKIIY